MVDVREYETWLWGQALGDNTVRQRTKFARARLREWGRLDVEPSQIAAFLARYHGWTRVTYHASLASLYRWAVETGRVSVDPMARMQKPPPPRPQPKPLTPDEERRVLETATGDLRLWLQLGLLAGLRRFEIAKLRGEEVDERAFYFVGKGGQLGMVPTHPDLWAELRGRARRGWVFPSPLRPGQPITASAIDQAVRKHFRAVGVEGGIHRTRATYGTDLLRNGANIRVVQELMRHRSLRSTEHYLHAAEDELVNAIRSLRVAA